MMFLVVIFLVVGDHDVLEGTYYYDVMVICDDDCDVLGD